MSATAALAALPDELGKDPVETNSAEESVAIVSPQSVVETPSLSHAEREKTLARIKQSAVLPPALRERLTALVESSGQERVPLDACLQAIEESLPDFVSAARAEAAQPAHPAGEAFFRGSSSELSDAEAEALAQQQLSRSGLLRGQRVRVAD